MAKKYGAAFVRDMNRLESDRAAGKLTDKQATDHFYGELGVTESQVARELADCYPKPRTPR